MGYAVQWVRSFLFSVQMYVVMPVVAVVYLPWSLFSPYGALAACHAYARYVCWCAGWMIGLRTEIRGEVPRGQVMVAAKHQSFLDILLMWAGIPRGFFVVKAILRFAPIIGQYAMRIGCIPVNRGRRAEAIKEMLAAVRSGDRAGGQLLIYPQGTRVAPGAVKPYKVGTFALYEQLGQPCYPVATNVGVFWPKRGVLRKPGLGVVEFLEPIQPGLNRETFMALLEERIETASNRLMEEAGFPVATQPPVRGDPVGAAVRETVARD